MKKVIHYTNGAFLENTENWIYEQIANNKWFDPMVYAKSKKNTDVYPIRKIRTFNLDRGNNLMRLIDRISIKISGSLISPIWYLYTDKPDLIHAHFGNSGHNFLLPKKITRVPMVTTFYGFDLSLLPKQFPEWKKKYKKLFQIGERFLVEGSNMKKELISLGCPEKKISILKLGVDLKKIRYKKRMPNKSGEIKILIAGRFTEKKGIPYALEAIGKISKQYPKIKITLIGDSSDTVESKNEKIKITQTIKKYKLTKHIRVLGSQPHSIFIKELYNNNIFIHPSITASNGDIEGGAPVSIIEASASGMPVISTQHCDIPEVIINGKTGYLVPEKNTQELAEKIQILIEDNQKCHSFGINGRKHIKENYDAKIQGVKIAKIYRNEIEKYRSYPHS